jgi:hypothetical protein
MKKIYTALVFILVTAQFSYAQWSTGTGTIYPTTITDKVGIGTTSPDATLTVMRSANSGNWGHIGNAYIIGNGSGAYPSVGYNIASTGGSTFNYALNDYASWVTFASGGLKFNVAPIGTMGNTITTVAAMTILNNGSVGIANTTPSGLLTVGSSSTRGTIDIVGTTSATPLINLVDSRAGAHTYSLYNGLSGVGYFNILDQNAGEYRFTITPLGNIGIGMITPNFKLQIKSDVAGVAAFGSGMTGNTGNISILNSSNYAYGVIGVVAGTTGIGGDVYGLGYSSNPNNSFNNVLNWTSTGKVGIGTNSPDDLLAVNGTIHSKRSGLT